MTTRPETDTDSFGDAAPDLNFVTAELLAEADEISHPTVAALVEFLIDREWGRGAGERS